MNEYSINDLMVKDLAWEKDRLTAVTESDPLMRRFGQADVIRLVAEEVVEVRRQTADEIWTIISGEGEINLTDLRKDSPSFEKVDTLTWVGLQPKAVLVPFGVQCRVWAETDCLLLRLTTHQDNTLPDDLHP